MKEIRFFTGKTPTMIRDQMLKVLKEMPLDQTSYFFERLTKALSLGHRSYTRKYGFYKDDIKIQSKWYKTAVAIEDHYVIAFLFVERDNIYYVALDGYNKPEIYKGLWQAMLEENPEIAFTDHISPWVLKHHTRWDEASDEEIQMWIDLIDHPKAKEIMEQRQKSVKVFAFS